MPTSVIATSALLATVLALPGSHTAAGVAATEVPCPDGTTTCRTVEEPGPTGRPRPGPHGESSGTEAGTEAGTGTDTETGASRRAQSGGQREPTDPTGTRSRPGTTETRSKGERPSASDVASAAAAFGWGRHDETLGHDFDGNETIEGWNLYDSPGHAGNGQRRPSQITVSDGVLRIEGTSDGTSGGMMGSAVQPEFGRWEVRMRVDKRGDGGAYHPVVALVPYGQDYNGGAGDLDFAETDAGSGEVYCFIHYPGRQDYRKVPVDLAEWHTYAIEVTRSHIVWFVDGEIAMVNTNEAAVTGTPWTLNLQLDAYQPSGQAPSTMEVDHFRYHPLPDGGVPTPDGPAPLTGSFP